MKRKGLRVVVTVLLTAIFVLGGLLADNATQAHAAAMNRQGRISLASASLTGQPVLITRADPYVHISNYHATIDPAINKVLSKGEVALVTLAVRAYNALPYSTKAAKPAPHTGVASTSVTKDQLHTNTALIAASAPCPEADVQIYGPYVYWWGDAFTLNNCAVKFMWWAVYIDASAALAIAAFCGAISAGVCAAVETVLAIYIGATVAALNGANDQCGDEGANLNFETIVSVPPWVNAIC